MAHNFLQTYNQLYLVTETANIKLVRFYADQKKIWRKWNSRSNVPSLAWVTVILCGGLT